ncbi:MAG: nucleotidyltransferase family protein [Clostridiales bacterium]|nr:nucleotidyltransferase family protein [Clostridiales bacterium]
MITKSQSVLLEAIKSSLFDFVPNYPSDICWNEVLIEAKAQTLMGLISPVVPVKDETSEHCKAMYMRIMYEQDRLLKCFEDAQIPCVVLKGSAAAVYYPRPFLRTMGDIDILVARGRFLESLDLLEANGYVYDHGKGDEDIISENTRELAYLKNGICVEIHQKFSSPGVDVDEILDAAIEKRELCKLNGYSFPILPCSENGLVLLGHINQHLKNNVLGLRQIIDWEMYIHSIEDKNSWRMQFVPLLEQTGLLSLAAYVTKMCNRYLGLANEVDFGIEVDDTLVDELLDVVMTDGNFGRRVYTDKNADEQGMISASYGIRRNGFFGYFTHVGLVTSSFCRKHSSLKVLAFFYGLFRQLGRGFRASFRNKNVVKNMSDGKNLYEQHSKRQELYLKLGVRTGRD